MGTADPFDSLLEAKSDLDLILSLQRRRKLIRLQSHHGEEWLCDFLRDKVTVVRHCEAATDDKPAICDYELENGDDKDTFVLDCSKSFLEPDEDQTYYVRLTIQDSDDELLCKWSVKHFSAAISPKLWLLTVEFCEE